MKRLFLGVLLTIVTLTVSTLSSNGQHINNLFKGAENGLTTAKSKLTLFKELIQPSNGGTIVMEDIVLRVDTGNPSDPVDQVKIYESDNLVFSAGGCGSSSCNYNLEELDTGVYEVKVSTVANVIFSAQITR